MAVNPVLFDLALQRIKQSFVPSDAAAAPPPGAPPGMPPGAPPPGPPMADPSMVAPPGMPPGPPMADPSMMAPPGMPPEAPPPAESVDIDSKIQQAVQKALQGAGLQGSSNPKQAKPDINTIATDIFQIKKMILHDLRLRGVELPPEILDGPNRDPMTGAAAPSPSGGSDVPAGISLEGPGPIKSGPIVPALAKKANNLDWPTVIKAAAELVHLRGIQRELDLAKQAAIAPLRSTAVAARPEEPPPQVADNFSVGTECGPYHHRQFADKAAAAATLLSRRRRR